MQLTIRRHPRLTLITPAPAAQPAHRPLLAQPMTPAQRAVHDAVANGRVIEAITVNPAVLTALARAKICAVTAEGRVVLAPAAPGWHLVAARQFRELARERLKRARLHRDIRDARNLAADLSIARFFRKAAIDSQRAAREATR